MKDSERIKEFLEFLRDAKARLQAAIDTEKETEMQMQDVMHRLEFYRDSYHETARIGKLMGEIRRERRKAKEAYERLSPIVDWTSRNKEAVRNLERLLGTTRETEKHQENRMWTPRTDILDKVEDTKKPPKAAAENQKV